MCGNYKNFTKDQVEGAILARKLQAMLAHLPDDKFKLMVSQGTAGNCDVKVTYVSNTTAIFGPYLPGLMVQTVREKPERVEPQCTHIPWVFYRLQNFVTLVADMMFVNSVPFMVTQSRDIHMLTAKALPNHKIPLLCRAITNICRHLYQGGFVVRLAFMDKDFEKIKEDFTAVEVNTTASQEHMAEIERAIRFIKDHMICVVSTLLDMGFKYYHCVIIVNSVYFVIMMINGIPAPNSILGVISQQEIVTGIKFNFKKDCRVPYGAYIEASTDTMVTNNMSPRTKWCLLLGLSGNL